MRIVENKDIDHKKWELLVKSDPYGFPYSSSWYLDTVAPNWSALVVDDYEYALPLPLNKKYGINYVFPPSFTQQIGIIGNDIASENRVKKMLLFVSQKYRYLEFNLNKNNSFSGEIENCKIKKRRNLELNLTDSYDKLYENYHKNTKRNLKKCISSGLYVEKTDNYDALISTFIEGKGKKIKGRNLNYSLLTQLIEKGNEMNAMELLSIKKDDLFLGAALFLNHLKRKVFLFSAINELGRTHKAMFFLIDHMIKVNAETDQILDFEGSDDDKLATFYKRFGAKENLYLHLKINRLPFFLKWIKG